MSIINIRNTVRAHLFRERFEVFLAVMIPFVFMVESGYARECASRPVLRAGPPVRLTQLELVDDIREGGPQLSDARPAQRRFKFTRELLEDALGYWCEGVRAFGQEDTCRTRIGVVGLAADETVPLKQPREGRDRLLTEVGAPGELAEPQAVFFEERDEHGAI